MKILSHRGYWKTVEQKNSPLAFEQSFGLGFGTETDLRDLGGRLVVSHDPPVQGALAAEMMLEIHQRHDPQLPLALNIKADGLQRLLVDLVERFALKDAFVFDMSVPDTIQWMKSGLPVFTRHSDVEETPALYKEASGIWLDGFYSDWWDATHIRQHLDAGKRVCIVSPELHRREHRRTWDLLAAADVVTSDQVMICTDFPQEALEVLGHAN
jgi:glycerophosphoryl diester phosphodiesterase